MSIKWGETGKAFAGLTQPASAPYAPTNGFIPGATWSVGTGVSARTGSSGQTKYKVSKPGDMGAVYADMAEKAAQPPPANYDPAYYEEMGSDPYADIRPFAKAFGLDVPDWPPPAPPAAVAAQGIAQAPESTAENEDFGGDEYQDYFQEKKGFFDLPTHAEEVFSQTNWNADPATQAAQMEAINGLGQPTALSQSLPGYLEARDKYMGGLPNLADADLAPYYEDAKRRATESIDSWAGAQGAYGSSAALQLGADEVARLEGERAKNEADYNLDRAAEMRQQAALGQDWEAGYTDAAGRSGELDTTRFTGKADIASEMEQTEITRKTGEMVAATGADSATTERVMSGFEAAAKAEGLSSDEKNAFLDRMQNMSATALGIMAGQFEAIISSGQELTWDMVESIMAEAQTNMGVHDSGRDSVTKSGATVVAAANDIKDLVGPGTKKVE